MTPDEPVEGPPAIIEQRPARLAPAAHRHGGGKSAPPDRTTGLTYSEIAKKTGVGRASICRWARDGKWLRPAHAPRATDLVPTLRAGRRLRMRMLATRLEALAQRHVRELEEAPNVDPDKLMQALQLVKMTRLEAMGRRRRRRFYQRAAHRRVGI